MAAKGALSPRRRGRWKDFGAYFVRHWQLYLIVGIPLIYILIFNYYPMYGVQIAFKDFSGVKGILGSPWAGMKYFAMLLNGGLIPNCLLVRSLGMYNTRWAMILPFMLSAYNARWAPS